MTYIPPNPNGRAIPASSAPVVLSTEDKAAQDSQVSSLAVIESNSALTASSTDLTTVILADILTDLQAKADLSETQPVYDATATSYLQGIETFTNDTAVNTVDLLTKTGATNETAPGTDTAASGLNGRLQRIAQRISSLIGLFPSSLGTKTKATSLAVTLASDETLPLPTGAATAAKQDLLLTELQAKANLSDTQPVSDSVGNGHLLDIVTSSQNAETVLNAILSLDLAITTAAKGATGVGSPTSTPAGADHQALDVILRDATGAYVDASAGGGGGASSEVTITDLAVMVKQALSALNRPPYMNTIGNVRVELQATGTSPVTVTSLPILSTVSNLVQMGAAATDQSFNQWTANRTNFNLFLHTRIL